MRPVLAALVLAGCVTSDGATGQGGAKFNPNVSAPRLPAGELFGVCWPADATPVQRIKLATLPSGQVVFEATGGASNSTGRCLVEIATSYPDRKTDSVELAPPSKRPSGWATLAYVQLLSAARFGPERGLLDPAGLVRACLSKGDGLRVGARFQVTFDPDVKVRLESSDGRLMPPLTAGERCAEAVLGATAWPSTRSFTLEFESPSGGEGEVSIYFGPEGAQGGLDPVKVKEAMGARGSSVSACWEQALSRRPGLGGGRSVRLRVGEAGTVTHVWVVGNFSAEPLTLADYLLDVCLTSAAKSAHFPGGSPGDAVYSWVFAQRG